MGNSQSIDPDVDDRLEPGTVYPRYKDFWPCLVLPPCWCWGLIICCTRKPVRGIPPDARLLSQSERQQLLSGLEGKYSIEATSGHTRQGCTVQDDHISQLFGTYETVLVKADGGYVLSGGMHTEQRSTGSGNNGHTQTVTVPNSPIEVKFKFWQSPSGEIYFNKFGSIVTIDRTKKRWDFQSHIDSLNFAWMFDISNGITTAPSASGAEEVAKLKALLESGAITEEEFQNAKKKALGI